MLKEFEGLIKLINMSIYGTNDISQEEAKDYDWIKVLEEARVHNCWSIVFPGVKQIQKEYNCIDEKVYTFWKNGTMEIATKQCIKNYELQHVIDLFEKNAIRPVVFKGPVVAKLYPEYLLRTSGDADVLIDEDDLELANKLLLDEGYSVIGEISKDTVPVYYKENRLKLELHTSLWEECSGDMIKVLDSFGVTDYANRYRFYGCDVECDTLGYTEHLVYIIYHIVKHFIPSGVGIRHLLDLTLYVNKFYDKLDMNKLDYCLGKLGYQEIVNSFFIVCINYLGMTDKILGDCSFDMGQKEYNLLEDIMDAGVFGGRTLDRVKTSNIVSSMYYKKDVGKVSKAKVMLNTMFPSADALSDRYVNAKKHKILLPVAWCQRAAYHVKQKSVNKDEPNLFKKANLADERIRMLSDFGLNSEE